MHRFNRDAAAKKLLELKSKSRLSLRREETQSPGGLEVADKHALDAVLLPVWRAHVESSKVTFRGRYGVPSTESYYDWNAKKYRSRTVYSWHQMGGELSGRNLGPEDSLTLYAGLSYPPSRVQEAVCGRPRLKHVVDFVKNEIPENVIVDPFQMRELLAESVVHSVVEGLERERIVSAVKKTHGFDSKVQIDDISIKVESQSIQAVYLAAYTFQGSHIMSAFDNQTIISGYSPLDLQKTTALGMVTGLALGAAFPALRAARTLWAVGGVLGIVLGAGINRYVQVKSVWIIEEKQFSRLPNSDYSFSVERCE